MFTSRCLCTGENGVGRSGKILHFKGSSFHRVIPKFMVSGGICCVCRGVPLLFDSFISDIFCIILMVCILMFNLL